MLGFITFILVVAWLLITYFCPVMMCGYGYKDLWAIMNNRDLQNFTQFLTELGLTEENSAQVASKYFIMSIVISICVFIGIVIIVKLLKKLFWFIEFGKQKKANKTIIINQSSNGKNAQDIEVIDDEDDE